MSHVLSILAATETAHTTTESTGGIAALGLNWQAFLFQLITFVIVLIILRQFVFKKLTKVLEDRRVAVEKSLQHAMETEAKLKETEATIAKMIEAARSQADDIVASGHKQAGEMIEVAEKKAVVKAEHIIKEAKAQMDVEVTKARVQLRSEAARLVAVATEQIIKQKLDPAKDKALIVAALDRAKEQV